MGYGLRRFHSCVGEKQKGPFQPGLILVCELDARLAFGELIT